MRTFLTEQPEWSFNWSFKILCTEKSSSPPKAVKAFLDSLVSLLYKPYKTEQSHEKVLKLANLRFTHSTVSPRRRVPLPKVAGFEENCRGFQHIMCRYAHLHTSNNCSFVLNRNFNYFGIFCLWELLPAVRQKDAKYVGSRDTHLTVSQENCLILSSVWK